MWPPQADEEQRDEGARDKGAAALLRRAEREARAEQRAERLDTGRLDTGWLDSFTQMGVAIYSSNNQLLVPGRKIRRDPAEGAGDGAAAMRTSEETGPTSRGGKEEDPAAVADGEGGVRRAWRRHGG